jgi:molybdopterin-guanine dinucleotide biosynthesis protein A
LNPIKTSITAFILSGGKSSRIGRNKSLLEIDGKPLIQRLTELLDSIFPEVLISSNEPELYDFLGKKIVKDIYPGRGPLSGIHSALSTTVSEKNFIIGCDLPFISIELINYLTSYQSDVQILLLRADERVQPLCGIYSKSILQEVEKLLVESANPELKLKGSIFELMSRVQTEIIDVTKSNFYHPDLFFNVNTPEDFNYAKSIIERK